MGLLEPGCKSFSSAAVSREKSRFFQYYDGKKPSPVDGQTMAKANKSQMVRELLESNPEMKAKEVVTALAEIGHKISSHLVYFVKGQMKADKQRKAHVVKTAKAATASSSGTPSSNADAMMMIREVKTLALKVGGYEQLKALVDALAE